MSSTIVVSFGSDREYSFIVHDQDIQKLSKDQAQVWLAEEFEELECVPSNPVGKILLVDMILNVAKYGGEDRFRDKTQWALQFVNAVASTLPKRSAVRVDVSEFVLA
jgi:hypothetical protein